jgi:hypothetical protein
MNANHRKIVWGFSAWAALCFLTVPFWGRLNTQKIPVSQTPPQFSAERALNLTREFITQNPKRDFGSMESRQAAGFIRDELKRIGYRISPPSYFNAIIAGKKQEGSNIIGFREGTLPGILVILAHYDTARTTVQGAMDDGGGIGVMLELAGVFANSSLRHGLLIVASDGEEWGALGAADLAGSYPDRARISAVLSLDGVAIGDLSRLVLDAGGFGRGYAPAWLRRITETAALPSGLSVASASGLMEHMQRALAVSGTDQGPLLGAGIAAINLSSRSVDKGRENEIYHTDQDIIGNLKASSIAAYGLTAERILRSLDENPPSGSMDDGFRCYGDNFIAPWAIRILHVSLFLPFLAAIVCAWTLPTANLRTAGREILVFLAWLAPFLLVYSLLLFFRLMRLLPRGSASPGPFRDPILASPSWGMLSILAGTALLFGIAFHFWARYLTRSIPANSSGSKQLLLTGLALVVAWMLIQNSYAATAFLFIPACVWLAIGKYRKPAARLAAAAGIVSAGAVMILAIPGFERGQNTIPGVLWYAVLALGNGMLTWSGFLLIAVVATLGLRLMALQFSRN